MITRDQFYASHTICPSCKSGDLFVSNVVIITSEAHDFKDKLNSARCNACNWRGKVIDLLADEHTEKQS